MDRDSTQDMISASHEWSDQLDDMYYRELRELEARRRRGAPNPRHSFYANEAHNLLGARHEDVKDLARFNLKTRVYTGYILSLVFTGGTSLLILGTALAADRMGEALAGSLIMLPFLLAGIFGFIHTKKVHRLLGSLGHDNRDRESPSAHAEQPEGSAEKSRRIEPRL